MKSESLLRSIDAMCVLGRELPLSFVIVGDGAARPELERRAAEANAALGRPAVTLAGALLDPRPAYAAADMVIGMGSSALRGLAFGKSVIVVGEQGFSAVFDEATAESFYYRGMYGRGDGDPRNERLVGQIRCLANDRSRLAAIGQFSHRFAAERFSLEVVCARLADLCRRAVADRTSLRATAADALRTAAVYFRERRFLTPSREKHPVDVVEHAIG